MKRSLSLIALFACLGLYTQAQSGAKSSDKLFYFDVTYGWALPQGNFASETPPSAGYAVHGSQFTGRFGIAAAKNFALEADYFYARYGVVQGSQINGLYLDNWKYSGFTFGPAIKAPMGSKFEANFLIKGGMAFVKSAIPDISNAVAEKKHATTFVMKPGLDLRLHITHNVFLIGDFDWAFMNPKFKFSDGSTLDQQISAFHLGFGVGVRF